MKQGRVSGVSEGAAVEVWVASGMRILGTLNFIPDTPDGTWIIENEDSVFHVKQFLYIKGSKR